MTRPGTRYAHRLLAPRTVYLIGTRSADGESNLIPISNVTSVSIDPQLVVVAVSKKWQTHQNLQARAGFTLSVPSVGHHDGVWRLGNRYSGHKFTTRTSKLSASGLNITDDPDLPGPILSDGHGWACCTVQARPDLAGDHGIFIADITRFQPNLQYLHHDGTPVNELRPLQQITGNHFTTTGTSFTLPYGPYR
jgi:flavin reductase (DIM6/NTAB) family NADH-FMN oxidoreductase RutF